MSSVQGFGNFEHKNYNVQRNNVFSTFSTNFEYVSLPNAQLAE